MVIAKMMLRLVLYTALVAISAMMIQRDAGLLIAGRKFIEASHTEWTQAVFILLTILVFLFTGKRFAQLRPVSFMVTGGMSVMLIREMDYYLDVIFHGAWFPVALVVLATTLFLGYRQRHELRQSIECFMATPAFGFFVSGGLGVFVFSRLFGAKGIWMDVFQVDRLEPGASSRWVKNAVEEGSELFGYCLIFCGAIELLSFAFRHLGLDGRKQ